jgi:predicted ABC-type ATPase
MSEPICTVMVGLPGLGKSTLIDGMYKPDAFIYSTDAILERIAAFLGKTYNDVFEQHINSATAEADIDLADAIKKRQDIIWDQTNLGAGKRGKIIRRMRQAGYQVRCVCIVLPAGDSQMEDWQYRLANRPGKTIPDSVLSNMYKSFVLPSKEEGFDMITFYNMQGALLGVDLCEND